MMVFSLKKLANQGNPSLHTTPLASFCCVTATQGSACQVESREVLQLQYKHLAAAQYAYSTIYLRSIETAHPLSCSNLGHVSATKWQHARITSAWTHA
jgi:hypothetical protein